jgi:lysophospholipase L1-like esterase
MLRSAFILPGLDYADSTQGRSTQSGINATATNSGLYSVSLTTAPLEPVTVTIRTDARTLITQGQIRRDKVNIMPIGDSITYGVIDSSNTESGGYRTFLWQLLEAGGYRVNFVGSQANGPSTIDDQHEGYRGQTITQIARSTLQQIAQKKPDAVLLLAGTNDINRDDDLAHAPQRLKTLINEIFSASPRTDILVGTLPPNTKSANNLQQVQAFNTAIRRLINSSGQGDSLKLVDLYEQLTFKDLADRVHLTVKGYKKIASSWYKSLINILNDSDFSSLSHTQKLTFTAQNWNVPQSITVVASGKTGSRSVIQHQVSSADANYSDLVTNLTVKVVHQRAGIKVISPKYFSIAPDPLTGEPVNAGIDGTANNIVNNVTNNIATRASQTPFQEGLFSLSPLQPNRTVQSLSSSLTQLESPYQMHCHTQFNLISEYNMFHQSRRSLPGNPHFHFQPTNVNSSDSFFL